jgi:ribosomal protein S18 acetylase RimI-like enzyme
MPGCLIRLALPEDDYAIGELLVESYVDAYRIKMPEVVVSESRKSELRDVASKRTIATVLVLEDTTRFEIAGTLTVFPPGAPGSEAWLPASTDLRHLAIGKKWQAQGFSNLLLAEAEKVSLEMGAKCICLHVRRGAFGVARLYESRGFQRAPEGDLQFPNLELDAYFLNLKP